MKLKGKIENVLVDPVGSGDHVVVSENRTKTIHERVRCCEAALKYHRL